MAKHKSQSWYLITVSKDSGNGFNSPVTTVTFFRLAFYKITILSHWTVIQNSEFVTELHQTEILSCHSKICTKIKVARVTILVYMALSTGT